MDNRVIAQRLASYAHDLEGDAGSVYRVKAYRRAAETIMGLDQPVEDIVAARGRRGLETLPGIGTHLAFTIERLVRTGEFRTMIPDSVPPEERLDRLPGVGEALARLIEERLGATTITALAEAARQGRLDKLELGPARLKKLREALAARQAERPEPAPAAAEPTVAELLAVDAEYRRRAGEDGLPTLAPRRFNPAGESWLPLYHVRRNGWRYRALFSNTALAHRLGKTREWVVIYFSNGEGTWQRTVVTEKHGELAGKRVVRGREAECRAYYLYKEG